MRKSALPPDSVVVSPLVGITVTGAPALTFAAAGASRTLKWKDDYVAGTKHVAPTASLNNSDLVFVGYGTEAPEFQWDDFKGMDVAGKTLVMLVNDPALADTAEFCAAYGYGLDQSANAIVVVGTSEPRVYAACLVLATTLASIRSLQQQLKTLDKTIAQELAAIPQTLSSVPGLGPVWTAGLIAELGDICLLYTSDAADDLLCVDLGGRTIIKKKKTEFDEQYSGVDPSRPPSEPNNI